MWSCPTYLCNMNMYIVGETETNNLNKKLTTNARDITKADREKWVQPSTGSLYHWQGNDVPVGQTTTMVSGSSWKEGGLASRHSKRLVDLFPLTNGLKKQVSYVRVFPSIIENSCMHQN